MTEKQFLDWLLSKPENAQLQLLKMLRNLHELGVKMDKAADLLVKLYDKK